MSLDSRDRETPGALPLDETGSDAVSQRDFRDAMASLAATACVVTAGHGANRLGRTVTAALSLSVEPPAILVSIDARSALAAIIRDTHGFSFAMLSETQGPVADAFAGKQAAEHRFDYGDWQDWSSGRPRLLGAVAALDCAVIGEMEVSGHILFVGGPREIDLDPSRKPLVWHQRQYHAVNPL